MITIFQRPGINPKSHAGWWSVLLFSFFVLLAAASAAFGQDTSNVQALPSWQVGTTYPYQLQAQGGSGSLTWRKVAGELPDTVSLDVSGRFVGAPMVARPDPYVFTVEVGDQSPVAQKVQMQFSIVVTSSLRIVAPLQIIAAGPGAAASPTPNPNPQQSNSEKVSITVSEKLDNPNSYIKEGTSEIQKDKGGDLITATLKTRETFQDKDYCIVHVVRWTSRAGKFESDDHWYLFQYQVADNRGLWMTAPLEKSARLLGSSRVAVLLVHLEADPKWDIKYDVSITEKTPQNVTNLMTLLGVVAPGPGSKANETLPSRWGGKLLKALPTTSELAFSGQVTFLNGDKQSQDAQSFAKSYNNEGRAFWDVSVGIQLKATNELQYNAPDGVVTSKKTDRQNAFGMLNIYPWRVDVRGDEHNILRTTHFFAGVPISGKPLDNPIAGMGIGIYKTPLKVNVFAGITFTKVRDPVTLTAGDPATQSGLESDFKIHRVHKFIFGVDFPLSQIKDALKKK